MTQDDLLARDKRERFMRKNCECIERKILTYRRSAFVKSATAKVFGFTKRARKAIVIWLMFVRLKSFLKPKRLKILRFCRRSN